MDFLAGLQKALAQGITKEDYTDIWKKETELKIYNSKVQNSASGGTTLVDVKNDKECGEKNPLIPLLKHIAERQDMVQQQQISIQDKLKQLQIVQEIGQQQLRQQFEEAQKGLSEKVIAIETSLANLQSTLELCVRETSRLESLDIQEKLSNMSQTFYNHLLEEMRKVTGVSKTVDKADKSKIAEKKPHILEENAGKDITSSVDKEDDNDGSIDLSFYSVDDSDGLEKMESLLVETQTDASRNRNVCSTVDDENSNSLKSTLHCELNTFLVNIQKLLLKPINSEDVSHHIIEKIKKFLRDEKNLTSEQLLDVQTAVSGDVQARLYRLELCLKNEISKIVSILEHNEKTDVKMDMILEETEKIKSFLSSELPSRIVSHPKWASIFEKRNYVNIGGGVLNEDRANTVFRSNYSHEQGDSSQVNKPGRNNIYGFTASDGDTQAFVEESSSEQVQTILLMLSMYVLVLLIGNDTETRERTPGKPQPRKTTHFLLPGDKAGRTNTHEAEQNSVPQEGDIFQNLSDEHLQFMFKQHKPANFLFDISYSTLSSKEEVSLKLEDIAPGYNLQLKSFISDTKNVNFLIQAMSGTKDDFLLWPANFNITITLVNKKPLATSKASNWHSFTKSKSLFKPNKMTNRSTAIPICYFRDDVVNSYVFDETLTIKVSVNYVGGEEDPHE